MKFWATVYLKLSKRSTFIVIFNEFLFTHRMKHYLYHLKLRFIIKNFLSYPVFSSVNVISVKILYNHKNLTKEGDHC